MCIWHTSVARLQYHNQLVAAALAARYYGQSYLT